jgi:surface polysaccharide O-acyltransferase-like enzyme
MNKNIASRERTFYLDLLRILATLAVVFFHQTGVAENPDIPWSKSFSLVCSGITRYSVPIFVMISGSLFLDNSRELSIKKLYTKNILRIVTSFFFWSAVYAIYHYTSPKLFLEALMTGRYHMWFLYMIVGLYILVPLLRKITADKKITEYFLIIGGIFGFGVFTFNMTPLAGFASGITSYVFDTIGLESFAGYIYFFVLGYYLFKSEFSKKTNAFLMTIGLLGCALSIVFTVLSQNDPKAPYYYSHFFIPVTLECVGVFIFGKVILSKIKFSSKGEKAVLLLSKWSFGVYLVHDLILTIIRPSILRYCGDMPVVAILCSTFITAAISLAISIGINKIPVLKKYVV